MKLKSVAIENCQSTALRLGRNRECPPTVESFVHSTQANRSRVETGRVGEHDVLDPAGYGGARDNEQGRPSLP